MNLSRSDLLAELKKMVVKECDLSIAPETIPDDQPLFGPQSVCGLDSIDALQVSVALQKQYNVTITDPKDLRRVTGSFSALADFVLEQAAGTAPDPA